MKTYKNRGCGNISTQFYKNRNKRERKGKEKKSYILILYIIFNMNWWIVSFFDDEKTTLRNKNYVKKNRLYGL